jgi:hypothetical protein
MASPGHWCFCSLVPGDRGISYKTIRTGTAIPTATGHGGRWRRLLPFILPQCGTVKATQSFRSSGRTPHPASSGTNATCGAAYPRAIPNHPRPAAGLPSPMPSPLTQQKHQLVPELGNRPCPAVAELHHVAHPLGSSAPPLRPAGIQHSAAPARPCAVDDLRRAVGMRRHDRRSPTPPPPEIPSSRRSRPPPSESRPATLGELRDELARICRRFPLPRRRREQG